MIVAVAANTDSKPRRTKSVRRRYWAWRPVIQRPRRIVAAWIGTAFAETDQEAAHRQWRAVADQLRPHVPRLAELMDAAEHDVLALMGFPAQQRAKINSTNPLERVNGEIKHRSDVGGPAAVRPLVGALLLEQQDEWAVQQCYMPLETMAPIGDAAPIRLPTTAT